MNSNTWVNGSFLYFIDANGVTQILDIRAIVNEAILEHENNCHNEDELEFSHDHKQYKIKEYD